MKFPIDPCDTCSRFLTGEAVGPGPCVLDLHCKMFLRYCRQLKKFETKLTSYLVGKRTAELQGKGWPAPRAAVKSICEQITKSVVRFMEEK